MSTESVDFRKDAELEEPEQPEESKFDVYAPEFESEVTPAAAEP